MKTAISKIGFILSKILFAAFGFFFWLLLLWKWSPVAGQIVGCFTASILLLVMNIKRNPTQCDNVNTPLAGKRAAGNLNKKRYKNHLTELHNTSEIRRRSELARYPPNEAGN